MTESVGGHLRELRTHRGISLEEMARITRVAPRYLQALENDAVNELPAPVFIRGFIRAYCQALGESPEEVLAQYDGRDGRTTPRAVATAAPRPSDTGDTRGRSAVLISFVLLVVLGVALFAMTLVIRPGERVERSTIEGRPPNPSPAPSAAPAAPAPAVAVPAPSAPTAPTAVTPTTPATPPPAPAPAKSGSTPGRPEARPGAAPSPTVVVSDTGAAAARVAAPTAPTASLESLAGSVSAPYRLIARTSDLTWIRVRTEDGRTSEETLSAGEVREWVSDRPFILTVGNAGGVSLELNGRALPSLGPRGLVVPRLVLPPEGR